VKRKKFEGKTGSGGMDIGKKKNTMQEFKNWWDGKTDEQKFKTVWPLYSKIKEGSGRLKKTKTVTVRVGKPKAGLGGMDIGKKKKTRIKKGVNKT